MNRRNVVIGLGALTVAAGAGIGWNTLSALFFARNLPIIDAPPAPVKTYTRHPTSMNGVVKHSTSVNGVAWSEDARLIASCSQDMVRVWSVEGGQDIFILASGDENVFNGLAWSPDGTFLAVASSEQGVIVLNASNGSFIRSFRPLQEHAMQVNGVTWSPNGTRIASANNDRTVQVWDAASGNNLATYQAAAEYPTLPGGQAVIDAVAWSPDGLYIVSGTSNGIVCTWNADTEEIYNFFNWNYLRSINAVAWSPNSLYIASASDDATVHILKNTGGLPFVYTGHTTRVTAVAWSPNGKRIASADVGGKVLIWNAFTGKNTLTYQGNPQGVNALAWSPDGRFIAAGSLDHSVKIWMDTGG